MMPNYIKTWFNLDIWIPTIGFEPSPGKQEVLHEPFVN